MIRIFGVLSFFCLMLCSPAYGQQSRETFGRNRIQYKQFEWRYVSSENFDIHFYGDRGKIAREAAQFLEGEFDRITDLLGFYPYQKTKIFLYNSVTDLQQSNVGLNRNQFNSGGETEFIKPYVEIAHPGNLEEFKEELIFKTSDLLVNEMMFGGSLKDMFQNAVLLNLPDWFVDGTSYYVAKGWSTEMDDYVRELVRSKKINRALKFTGKDAALVGQSIWNFIVEKYGKGSINSILNYTRIIRNEEKSVLMTLGVPFKQMITEWKEFYLTSANRVAQSYVAPEDSLRFTSKHRKSIIYTTVKLSPDGKKVAYAENDRGKFTVYVRSLENGKESKILNGGNSVIKQDVDYRVPLLSWADANTLGVIGVKQGQYIFWLYDLNSRSKLPRELDRFSNIRSFTFSGNGRLAVLSADFEGQNDLFLISSRRDRTKRITNDSFDDFDPSFIPNSNTIVFSSNRTTDSVATGLKSYDKLSSNFNLYQYNLDTSTVFANRLTNTVSRDFHPKAIDENNFFYLSDQRGIVNLFRFNKLTGIYNQVTNFNTSVIDYDINTESKKLAVVINNKQSEDIFVRTNFNFEQQVFTPATKRKEAQQAKVITERRKKEPVKGTSIKDLINSRLKEKKDTSSLPPPKKEIKKDSLPKGDVDTDNYTFDDGPVSSKKDTVIKKKEDKPINTDDYVFEDEAQKKKQPVETFLTRYTKAREVSRIAGPFPYTPKFSYENLITNFVIDPLRGFSVRLETQMNDMLENYRFFGGIQTAFDWKSGDVYAEVQYLPRRIDFSARFDRKVIFWETPGTEASKTYLEKYSFQKVEFGASLPLSVRTRISLKSFAGYTQITDRGLNEPSVGVPQFRSTDTQFYGGSKAEIVYDNSLTTGMNIIEGTRAKISVINYQAFNEKSKSFSQASLDLRHYQKIYKEIVFAVRGYAGTFFGNSPKKYVLGGMDNWFANKTNYNGQANPLVSKPGQYNENLLFTEFATSLRGFDYATLYGNSVAMASAELRVPLIRALAGGPITSNFFRNLQFTAFYDIGSSWSGALPFNSKNGGRTRVVPESNTNNNSPFRIEVKEYLNPWLYSYGLGLRTMMLGYYMKFDFAWPVENYTVKNPRLHVTIGFDF